jgi:TonB family protein
MRIEASLSMMTRFTHSIATALMTTALVGASPDYVSPRRLSGDVPATPALAVSGGEVRLELLVTPDGRVASVDVLQTTPPFTDAMIAAVRGWRFEPATMASKPVQSHVLVAGVFAPPTFITPTLGEPPQTNRAPSGDVLVATSTPAPTYPPRASGNGAVLVDVTVGPDGGIPVDARIVVSSPAFDAAALAAAKSWSFEAAQRDGRAITAHAYLLFAFRQPVT